MISRRLGLFGGLGEPGDGGGGGGPGEYDYGGSSYREIDAETLALLAKMNAAVADAQARVVASQAAADAREYDYGGSSYRDTETRVTTVATSAQPTNNLTLPIIAAIAAFLLFGS